MGPGAAGSGRNGIPRALDMACGLAVAAEALALPARAEEPTLDVLWTLATPEGGAITASAATADGLALLTSRGGGPSTRYLLMPEVTAGADAVPLDAVLDRHDLRLPILDGLIGRQPIRDPSPVALAAVPDGTFWIAGEADKGISLQGTTFGDAWFAQVDGQGEPSTAFTVDLGGWSPVLALSPQEGGVVAAGRMGAGGWVATADGVLLAGTVAPADGGNASVAAWVRRDGRLGPPRIVRLADRNGPRGDDAVLAVAAAPTTAYVTSGSSFAGRIRPVEVTRIDADGTPAWTRSLQFATCEPRSAAPVALGDGVAVLCLVPDAPILSVHRFDGSGAAAPVARFDAPCGTRASDTPLQATATGSDRITLAGASGTCTWAATLTLPRSVAPP